MTVSKNFMIKAEELVDFPAPESTDTYLGISHQYIYDMAKKVGIDAGFSYEKSNITMTREGNRAFMRLFFRDQHSDKYFFVGGRSTYDKSARVALASGVSVAVCSNLCIFGSDMVIVRKHTPNALTDLSELVAKMTTKAKSSYYDIIEFGQKIQKIPVTKNQGKLIIGAGLGTGILTHGAYLQAMQHWANPPFDEFKKEVNLWGVYNALTWGAHKMPMLKRMSASADISDFVNCISQKSLVLL
jgi:hypothetical protein